jgi:ABC-type Na+ efflux pump permease subunit
VTQPPPDPAPTPAAEPTVEAPAKPPRPRKGSVFAIIERELIRTARRWQTFGLRAAFAGILLSLVVIFWAAEVADAITVDKQSLAQSGRTIFQIYVWTQWAVLGALTPIVVAQSIIEEKEGRTLDLLAITRLPIGRILWGKLVSRIISLELLILAGMPVLAICMSLGGIELTQLANVWLQMTTMVLAGGAVAAFLGLYATGPFSVAMTTWFWMVVAFTTGPIPHAAATSATTDQNWAWISPFYALIFGAGWTCVGPLLTWLPVVALTMVLAAAGFRAMVANADDPVGGFGTLSKDFSGLRKLKTGLALLMVGLLAATPLVVFQRIALPFFPPIRAVSWLWNIGWLWLGTGVYLLAARASYIRLSRRKDRRHKRDWKKLVESWRPVPEARVGESAVAIGHGEAAAWTEMLEEEGSPQPARIPGATGRDMSGKPAQALTVARKPRFAPVRQVWSNPVAWRETVTRAHGGLSRMILRVYIVVGLMVGFLFFVGAFQVGPFPAIAGFITASMMAAMVVLMTATASIAGELRSRTLELLCATRMSSAEILWGKLLSTGLVTAPAFGAAVFMLFLAIALQVQHDAGFAEADGLGWLLRAAGLSAWLGAALLAVANLCHWIGLRSRSASRVWIWTVSLAAAWVVGPFIALALGDGVTVVEFLVAMVNPVASEQFLENRELPIQLYVSVGLWASLALAAFVDNVRQLNRRAVRE